LFDLSSHQKSPVLPQNRQSIINSEIKFWLFARDAELAVRTLHSLYILDKG
jgi:hypothetical protein